jgi:5-bromo-4-chloroindolyl phosphate hydrolysis protein
MGWGEQAYLTRWQLALIVLLLFAAVGTSIAVGITAVKASHRVAAVQRDQQANRISAIEELCEHDAAVSRHNIEFLQELNTDAKTLRQAKKIFRITQDCHTFALRAVRPK